MLPLSLLIISLGMGVDWTSTARDVSIPPFVFKGSLVDPRLRATFSPAHPMAHQGVPLAQASTFSSCVFHEQEDGQATLSILLIPASFSPFYFPSPARAGQYCLCA